MMTSKHPILIFAFSLFLLLFTPVFAFGATAVVETIAVGDAPTKISITPNATRAIVTHRVDGSISIIDLINKTIITPLQVGAGPVNVAITPTGTHALIPNFDDNTVSVIDLITNTVVSTIPVVLAPGAIAITPNNTLAVVVNDVKLCLNSCPTRAQAIHIIDLATNQVTTEIPFGDQATDIAITPDSRRAYILGSHGLVSIIDLTTRTLITTISLFGTNTNPSFVALDLAITPSGAKVYVLSREVDSDFFESKVTVVQASTNQVIATIPVGIGAAGINLTPNGTRAIVTNSFNICPSCPTNQQAVHIINLTDDTVSSPIVVLGTPVKTVFSPDSAHAYVLGLDGVVSAINLISQQVLSSVQTGTIHVSGDIGITRDGNQLYVTNVIDNTISILSTEESVGEIGTIETDVTLDDLSDGKPDLTATLTKVTHKRNATRDKLNMKLRIRNLGQTITATDRFTVSVWHSNDRILDDNDGFLKEEQISTSGLISESPFKVKLSLQDLPPLTSQFVLLTIDNEDSITEENENNNLLVHRVNRRNCQKNTWRLEQEPTSAADPQKIGGLRQATCITVTGTLETSGDIDSYRVTARENTQLTITLTHASTADFDLAITDLLTGQPLEICESNTSPATCTVELSEETIAQVTILPTQGAGPYNLDLLAGP